MQFENPMTFVRSLKGAPASVLWAFFYTRQAMTALELQQWTGYKGDNLTVALRLLVDLGWVSARSSRGPWCLVEGRQLPLMGESDLIGVRPGVDVDVDISFSPPTNTTSLTTSRKRNPIKSDSWTDEDRAKLAALDAAGIRGKKARELIRLPWVTVEYIEDHHAAIVDEDWDNPQGMMVYRIEGQEPAIKPKKKGHRENCSCLVCMVARMRNRDDDDDQESEDAE